MQTLRVCLGIIGVLFSLSLPAAFAANIDPTGSGNQYAWSENSGWINFNPGYGPGVSVSSTTVTGMAWGENIGWIDLSPAYGGVSNDGTGTLSGFAWGEDIGWIDFGPTGSGVTIDACGDFNGFAWSENAGWINFRADGTNPFRLTSSWVSPIDTIPPQTTYLPALQTWYTSSALFNFSASDCGSGVREIRYQINGAETVTPGATAQATVAQEGCNTLGYHAVDNADNSEAARQLSVCVDTIPPVVTITVPADGASYAINSAVTPLYTISDATSGVAATQVDTFSTATPGSHTFGITAADNAGNITNVTNSYTIFYPGNIDPTGSGNQYAWSENSGWINFNPGYGPGVTVSATALTGLAWGENIGWIDLSPGPGYGGVTNDGRGNLSGFAWGENIGWIDFNPTEGGVTIGMDGSFSGFAWGEDIGWINFDVPNAGVKSAWQNPYPPAAPFSFISQTTYSLNTVITSNSITVSGITTTWPIKISGGQYSINGGPFTPIAGTVNNGDQVTVKVTSAAVYAATTGARLAIGGVSASFSVTTTTPPPTIYGSLLTTAFVDTKYLFTPASAHADSFAISGPLPPGLVFDPATGTLSGKPTASGVYANIIISAINNTSGVASLPPCTITVLAAGTDLVIYYSRLGGNDGTIWSIQGNGSNDHQVTVGEQPRISPDGRYLAFHKGSPNSTAALGNLYVRDLQTGIETLVFSNNDYLWEFDWTGDSNSIVFDYQNCIRRVDRNGLNLATISCVNANDDAPSVNKVDGRIAFHDPGLGGLFIMDANGANRSHIANTTPSDVFPYWSPDGQWLAFWNILPDGVNCNLYKIHPDGSGRTVLSTVPVSSVWRPAWTADGSRLVFNGTVNASVGIYTIVSDGSGSPVVVPITAGAAPYLATDVFQNRLLPPTISGTPDVTATVNSYYSFIPTFALADAFDVIGNLPPGLALDPANGKLSGTPSTAGVYPNLIIRATNANGVAWLPAFTITVAPQYHSLTESLSGAGSGSISSITNGISFSCPGNCAQGYPAGTTLTLAATPSSTSYFSGWGGACSNNVGNCQVTLDADRTVSATFLPLPAIRYMLGTTPGYVTPATLQNVYDTAPAGATIQLMAGTAAGPLDAGTNKTIILKGGYDGSYVAQSGRTIISSPLKIRAGKVIANSIAVR